jgi:hypothetical protein
VSLGEVRDTKTRRLRAVRLLAPLARDLEIWREATPMADPDDLVFPRAPAIRMVVNPAT